ncbi:hypothetical protein J6590_063073 [Homalodisca vitripennis]|nr:hypothetical protein J6590_063073 [Homalodisca vitripennis]
MVLSVCRPGTEHSPEHSIVSSEPFWRRGPAAVTPKSCTLGHPYAKMSSGELIQVIDVSIILLDERISLVDTSLGSVCLSADTVTRVSLSHERTPVQLYQSAAPREPTTRPLNTGARTSSAVPTPGGTLVSTATQVFLLLN